MSSKNLLPFLAVLLLASACMQAPAPQTGIRRSTPEEQGMSSARLALIDSTVNASIADGTIPGAVVGIVRNGFLVYGKAYGNRALVPQKEPMTVETLFDLASVSKCVSTTIAVMQLVEQGKLRLTDPVSRYIPEFLPWQDPKTRRKKAITIQDLLTHASGLDAFLTDVPAYVQRFGAGTPYSLLYYISTEAGRHFEPGTDQLYSCFNFIVLQHIVERISGERLCDYAQRHIFDVLGLTHTCYFPLELQTVDKHAEEDTPAVAKEKADAPLGVSSSAHANAGRLEELVGLCAPTEQLEDGTVLRGQVHDPTARIVNLGNSGNAGVFSNMEDLAVICAALLDGGSYEGKRILSPLSVEKMFTVPAGNDPKVARALGWDTYYREPYTSGDIFPLEKLRGHTGYTGTSVLLDPLTRTAVIILSNRVHPSDKGSVGRLRGTVASIAASAIGG